MGVRKKTLSFPEEVWAVIETEARLAGMTPSAYVSATVLKKERLRRGLAAVDEYQAENGALSPESLAWADRMLDLALDPKSYQVDEPEPAEQPGPEPA